MKRILCLLLALALLTGCSELLPQIDIVTEPTASTATPTEATVSAATLEDIPPFSGEPYVVLNGNEPWFEDSFITTDSYEYYSDLDELGRCGVTYACLGKSLMPTEERGSISRVKPTGWQTVQYDFVDGKNLYNRCHLIGFQLAGENANARNLITGTRYLNVTGMLPFENLVCDYIKETGNHVMYRVTPVFDGDNLVADGVVMEGLSVEDEGDGVCFNVFCYNVQPGVVIDYATGSNYAEGEQASDEPVVDYIVNTDSKRFHLSTCTQAKSISKKNRELITCTRQFLLDKGYRPCRNCNP